MRIGNLGGLLGLGALETNDWGALQQQQLAQWVPYTGTASDTLQTNTYVVSAVPVEPAPVRAKAPETALEWLDRRVAEVRLPLVA